MPVTVASHWSLLLPASPVRTQKVKSGCLSNLVQETRFLRVCTKCKIGTYCSFYFVLRPDNSIWISGISDFKMMATVWGLSNRVCHSRSEQQIPTAGTTKLTLCTSCSLHLVQSFLNSVFSTLTYTHMRVHTHKDANVTHGFCTHTDSQDDTEQ